MRCQTSKRNCLWSQFVVTQHCEEGAPRDSHLHPVDSSQKQGRMSFPRDFLSFQLAVIQRCEAEAHQDSRLSREGCPLGRPKHGRFRLLLQPTILRFGGMLTAQAPA